MKTAILGLIIIAIANLLAGVGFAGWLLATDRLSMDRVRQLRQAIGITITAQQAAEKEQVAKVIAEKEAAEEAAKAAKPPLTASEQLAARVEATQIDRERAARLKQEVESLQRRLTEQSERLATERAELELQRKAFAAEQAQSTDMTASDQFQKALAILTSLKPAAAKSVLLQILRDPAATPQSVAANFAPSATGSASIDFAAPPLPGASSASSAEPSSLRAVVKYLDAMEDRARSKIMTEFAKEDPSLAAKLLEAVRNKPSVPVADPKGQALAVPAKTADQR